jgi:glycine oxidase
LVGSTEEDAGFEKRNTAAAVAELIGFASDLVPSLADATVERCWSGLRPGSPDGLPYLGRVPGTENLYVAAGHFRSGLQMSPGTAVLMRELMLGQDPSIPLDGLTCDRHQDFVTSNPQKSPRNPAPV